MELNPTTAARCRRNLADNGLTMVAVANCGVAGREGWIDFAPSGNSIGDSIYAPPAGASGAPGTSRVELVTLAALLDRHGCGGREFDWLKLDCEGAEYEILRATPAEVLGAFRAMVVEFHAPPAGELLEAARARLRDLGFSADAEAPSTFPHVAFFTRR